MKLWENYKIDFNYADAPHMPVKFLAIYFVITILRDYPYCDANN